MLSIQSRSDQLVNTPARQESKIVVAAKFLLVATIVAALVVAAYFSVIGLIALIAASAPVWQIGLLGIGAVASVTGAVGSIYFAGKHHMLEDTGHNGEDVKNFLIGSLC
ncbi:MAG: hypothetical protein K1X28_08800 [Parachlamydiales bacterium]|nr:hypothetical protein [Parachlamydiales bacterium]